MSASNLTQEMKRYSMLVALHVNDSYLEIMDILKVVQVNRRISGVALSEPQRVMYKFMLFLMVLSIVSNNGYSMPPHFFLQGLRVNATIYIEVLDMLVKPWVVWIIIYVPAELCSIPHSTHNLKVTGQEFS